MLFVDVTTTWQERGRHPHGTTRVERGLVAALARQSDGDVVFFRRDGASFVPISHDDALSAANAPTTGDLGRQPQPDWWRHPLVLRARALRRRLRVPGRALPPAPPPSAPIDPFVPGAALLFLGEHDRHDFARLVALKREKRLRLAFVFYDLLRVLDDHDPRLRDPAATNLPQTDFIVREAALVLPISRFSADELRRYCARRLTPGPLVAPIRLAGAVPAGAGQPVAGLAPGGFVLSVGDVVHRKNHTLLAEVWTRLGEAAPLLVIAGRVDREGDALAARVRRDPLLRRRLRILPDVGDEALIWLYRNCRYTLFPSLLEGFGLPVAESLSVGKVCLASTAAAIPEAGQGAAIGLDPLVPAAWEDAVMRLSDDAALQLAEGAVNGVFHPVSWDDTALDVLAAIGSGKLAPAGHVDRGTPP